VIRILILLIPALIAVPCQADLQLTDLKSHRLSNVDSEQIEFVRFKFAYAEHPGTPGPSCSLNGEKAIKLFKQIGFSRPEKLPGIPACEIIGSIELRLKNSAEVHSFDNLCGDLLRDRSTGEAYRLSKRLTFKVCD
jgi:hypothetical protein